MDQVTTRDSSHLGQVPIVTGSSSDSPKAPRKGTRAQTPSYRAPLTKPKTDRRVIWDVPFDCVSMAQTLDWIAWLIQRRVPSYLITANLHYVMLHQKVAAMQGITDNAAMILADGQPIVCRSRIGTPNLPERVAGSEMIFQLAARAAEENWGIYFLGGEPGVAQMCAEKLASQYPGLRVAGVESPPFRELSELEQAEQDRRILDAKADILLVAFGQPKGEQWIAKHHRRLGVPVSIQLGASFDFVAGTAKRAPRILQRIGMEWAYRMFSEPQRLLPRYAANAVFLFKTLCLEMLGKRTKRRS